MDTDLPALLARVEAASGPLVAAVLRAKMAESET